MGWMVLLQHGAKGVEQLALSSSALWCLSCGVSIGGCFCFSVSAIHGGHEDRPAVSPAKSAKCEA